MQYQHPACESPGPIHRRSPAAASVVSPACAAAVAEAALAWLSPAVLEPLLNILAAQRQRSSSHPAAEAPPTTGGADPEGAAQLGALAAVLHFLASYGEAVKLRREDLGPLRAAVAASALLAPMTVCSEALDSGGRVHPLLRAALKAAMAQRSAASAAAGAELLDAALALQRALQPPGGPDCGAHVAAAVSCALLPEVCGVEISCIRVK